MFFFNSLYYQNLPFANFFENRFSWRFRNIRRKTPVLDSLFKKVAGVKNSSTSAFLRYYDWFKNSFFQRIPPVATSALQLFFKSFQGYFSLEPPFIGHTLSLGIFISLTDFSAMRKALWKTKTYFFLRFFSSVHFNVQKLLFFSVWHE